MTVYIVIQVYCGVIGEPEVFRFEQDARAYYESLGGDKWIHEENADTEIHFYECNVRSMPVEEV